MGKNLRFWDTRENPIRYASDYNNDGSDTLGIQEALDDLPILSGLSVGTCMVDVMGEISDTINLYGGQCLEGFYIRWGTIFLVDQMPSLIMADNVNKSMIKMQWDGVNEMSKVFPIVQNLGLHHNGLNQTQGYCIETDANLMDMYISNVACQAGKDGGIYITSGKNYLDSGYCELNYGPGIKIHSLGFNTIRNYYIYGNQDRGLLCTSGRVDLLNSTMNGNDLPNVNLEGGCYDSKICNNRLFGSGTAVSDQACIRLNATKSLLIGDNIIGEKYENPAAHCNYGIEIMSKNIRDINIHNNIFQHLTTEYPIKLSTAVGYEPPLEEIHIGKNLGMDWFKKYIHRFKDLWVGHSLDTTHKWRGQATGTGVLPAYTAGPSFETVLFDIAAAGAGTSTLDMNGQRPFDAQFNSYIHGSCFIDDVSEADLYFGFYKDADEYAYFHVTQGNVYVKANDGGVHGPYSADTLVNVGDAETFHMMVEMLRSDTPRFKLNGAVVGTPTTGSAPSTGVGVDAYVHLANRNNSAIQGYLNPVEITSGRDLW